jgi:hypothetical protein
MSELRIRAAHADNVDSGVFHLTRDDVLGEPAFHAIELYRYALKDHHAWIHEISLYNELACVGRSALTARRKTCSFSVVRDCTRVGRRPRCPARFRVAAVDPVQPLTQGRLG